MDDESQESGKTYTIDTEADNDGGVKKKKTAQSHSTHGAKHTPTKKTNPPAEHKVARETHSARAENTESNAVDWQVWVLAIAAILILFNQYQIFALSGSLGGSPSVFSSLGSFTGGSANLADIDIAKIQNTAQSLQATFPLQEIKNADDAIKMMIATGTPEYGKELGISFDDPVKALNFWAYELYPRIKADVQKNDPQTWQRYLNFATKPVGISCEFCCGVGPVGITANGDLTCGCAHNPAIHAITLYLMKYTKMTDAEVLREAMRWKAIWFPKDMVGLALGIAGGDTSALSNVPGMVGGC